MADNGTAPASVDAYIEACPAEVRAELRQLRAIVREAAPGAQEKISYGMPAFEQHGILVYYAANKQHIGFYPTANGIAAFKDELAAYKSSKGAVQFPFGEPLPAELIRRIVAHRIAENEAKADAKKANKK